MGVVFTGLGDRTKGFSLGSRRQGGDGRLLQERDASVKSDSSADLACAVVGRSRGQRHPHSAIVATAGAASSILGPRSR